MVVGPLLRALAVRTVVPSIRHRLRQRRYGGIARTRAVNDRGQCTWRDERKRREKPNVPFHLTFTLGELGERLNANRCKIAIQEPVRQRTVTFALGTDPDIDTVNVQNRANFALALLPPEVAHSGLTIRKKSAALLQIINIYFQQPPTSAQHREITRDNFVPRLFRRIIIGVRIMPKSPR